MGRPENEAVIQVHCSGWYVPPGAGGRMHLAFLPLTLLVNVLVSRGGGPAMH